MPRSGWLRLAVEAFLESGASVAAVAGDAERAAAMREALRGTAETMARLAEAQSRPLPVRCGHRKRGAYCRACSCLVDVDGYPVRAP